MKPSDLTKIALFAALTAVGAWIAIPIPPVPFTFQVFFVLLAGAILGPARAGASQLVYLALGAIGLPVFAGGQSGIGAVIGPTGGYLVGFVVAAVFVGLIVKEDSGAVNRFLAMAGGVAIIYALGMVQLMAVTGMPIAAAFTKGVLLFVPFDLVKAVLAATLVGRLRTVLSFKPA